MRTFGVDSSQSNGREDMTGKRYRVETQLIDGTVVDVIDTNMLIEEVEPLLAELEAERAADTQGGIIGRPVVLVEQPCKCGHPESSHDPDAGCRDCTTHVGHAFTEGGE